MTKSADDSPKGELILYQTADGRTRAEVQFDDDTALFSLRQMAQAIKKPSGDAA